MRRFGLLLLCLISVTWAIPKRPSRPSSSRSEDIADKVDITHIGKIFLEVTSLSKFNYVYAASVRKDHGL